MSKFVEILCIYLKSVNICDIIIEKSVISGGEDRVDEYRKEVSHYVCRRISDVYWKRCIQSHTP